MMIKRVTVHLGTLQSATGRHRRILLMFGLVIFLAGLAWSVEELTDSPVGLDWVWFVPLSFLLATSIGTNALEMFLAARALRVSYPLSKALKVSCWATLANILPIPGGILVRGASLIAAGSNKNDVAIIIGFGAGTWIALSFGLVLFSVFLGPIGSIMGVIGAAIAICLAVWLALKFDVSSALALLVVRCALIGFTVARLAVLLALIGEPASWREAAAYSGASVAGQVVGIIPSGIGLVETVGAGLAMAIDAAPASAFLVLAFNRIVGLFAAGLVVLVAGAFERKGAKA